MAEADSTATSISFHKGGLPHSEEMRVTTARGGDRVFENLDEVRKFSKATAEDLAALSLVITESKADPTFSDQMWELANDLAFQLQQSVALMCEAQPI
ncbi:hypothetical protein [Ralstonia insidiosa]|uniref:DUF3077 domain-containing protein n=1 Tax=Ralstonia insidiosa TaxID=190721 RepID=A0A848PB72_9RALS|nr:hypothetical protein [Ralstonia insidiosa]NMV41846.1 hypothetical protein [Ralstonia insidiosa]